MTEPSADRLPDEIRTRFERACRAGARPTIEDFLLGHDGAAEASTRVTR
jgi:hypothetical protein